ncbi:dentin sialophosphoprotein-like [Aricia agestis]|uniref:dentin sialophosphoprotein-like n=1 Tax=Aricia agestis TaxID=91739 RepID=UPI001C204FB1|nr:dentin sialophosphoprotein-like [Aricia agestis]
MKLHGAVLICLVCGALAVPLEPKQSDLDKVFDYRRALLEFNWRVDESKHNLNGNLRGLLQNCKDGVDIPALEEKIQNLRSTYAKQIAEYRSSLESLYNSDVDPQLKFGEEHKQSIEANLRKAEACFESGLNKLSSSLERLKLGAVSVKADGDSDSGSSWWSSIYNFFASYFTDISSSEYVQNVQNTVSSLANNVTALFNQNQGIQLINNSAGSGSTDSSPSSDNSASENSSSDSSDNSASENAGLDISHNSASENSSSDSSNNSALENSSSDNSNNSGSDNYSDGNIASDPVDNDRQTNTKLPTPETPSHELHPEQNSIEPHPEQ